MIFDIHVHTTFSPDGKSSMEEYLPLLDSGRLTWIGFAEHLDFMPECGAYRYLNEKAYISSVKKLKAAGYQVYAGVEVDYSHKVETDILRHLSGHTYDYIICSVHMVDGMSVSNRTDMPGIQDAGRLQELIGKYYKEVLDSIKVRQFDVVGHVGVFKRYFGDNLYENRSLSALVREMDREVAKACAHSGKILEVNSSGLFAPCSTTIPFPEFLKTYKAYGGENICVGSDAHEASHAGRGLVQAVDVIREAGFRYLVLPWKPDDRIKI